MMRAVLTKSYSAPELKRDEIFRYMRVKNPDSDLERLVNECLSEALAEISYKVCYTELPIRHMGACIDLSFTKTESCSLSHALSGCASIVLFAATLGVGADRLIMRYSSRNPARALILDAIFTERIEALCDAFCSDIKAEKAKEGKKTCPRFSAGYGDFPLEAQRAVFAALSPEKHIGLSLSETLLMTPTKSVTALIGIAVK